MNGAQRKDTSSHLARSDFLFLTYVSLGRLWSQKMCAKHTRLKKKKTKQVFAQPFLRKMAYVTSFRLKLPGPLHPVSESLPSHQSRKNPLPSGMFKYLAFLLSPWLCYRVGHRHGDVTLRPPESILLWQQNQQQFHLWLCILRRLLEIYF